MPNDPVPAAPPVAADPPKPPRRPRGKVNAKYLDEIELARDLAVQARQPANVAPLTERAWPPAQTEALAIKADALERAAGLAVGRVAARRLDTAEEETARKELLAAIHPVRVGAKRKYRGATAVGREAFFVNEPTEVSLERLLFIAGELLRKLTPQPKDPGPGTNPPEDTLPGVTPGDLAALQTRRDAYVNKDADQSNADTASQAAHQDANTVFTALRALRLDLQLAADQAFPHADKNNKVVRGAFGIPADRPAVE